MNSEIMMTAEQAKTLKRAFEDLDKEDVSQDLQQGENWYFRMTMSRLSGLLWYSNIPFSCVYQAARKYCFNVWKNKKPEQARKMREVLNGNA